MVDTADTKPRRTWWLIAIGFAIFWVVYLAAFGPRRRAALESSGTKEKADYTWALTDLADRPASLSRFKGKAVFLNVWATWCGPCVSELPSIAKLASDPRLKDKNIAFVCVSIDDSAAAVSRFLEDKGWPMIFLRAGAGRVPSVFYSDGIPATFVIAPDGRIAAVEIGAVDWHEPRVVAFLEKLAASEPAAR
jgi:thiol-disulfide isomerase/thioredoxin